jgi:lipopolysaccharide export system permease protein
MLAEAHSRLAAPLYIVAFMTLALAAVIGGAFSRSGYGARIAVVAVAALATRMVGFAVLSSSASNPRLNVLQYAVPALVIVVCLRILLRSKRAPRHGSARRLAVAMPAKALSH